MLFEGILSDSLRYLGLLVKYIGPFLAFILLLAAFRSAWLFWRREMFKTSIKWILLELRIPREIKKSPQAMEQVLAALHSLRNVAGDIREMYWDGEVTRWFALEMVSFGGEIHFYIRTYYKQKNLVQAAFFSYYPDVEVVEVEDYVDKLPATIKEMYAQGYDMWGTEMLLAKEEVYPIKTYTTFFEAPEEERQFDPIAAFLEVLGKLQKGEIVGIQLLIAPAAQNWRDTGKDLVEKLRETKTKKEQRVSAEGQMESFARMIARSPGEVDILKAVENNISKQAFSTVIRFIYLSPRTIFYDSYARRGLIGAFNQYASLHLNAFVQNYAVSTRTRVWNWPHIFPKRRNEYRKQRLLYTYRKRIRLTDTFMGRLMTSYFLNWNFASKPVHMNTECLATIFHPPTFLVVTGPHIPRVESRKVGPPAGLAIFGEEREIEKFQ